MAAYLTAERDCGACLCSKDFLRSGSIFNPLSAKVAKLRQDVILHKIDCSS